MRPYHLHGNAGFSVQQNRSESCGSRSHTVAKPISTRHLYRPSSLRQTRLAPLCVCLPPNRCNCCGIRCNNMPMFCCFCRWQLDLHFSCRTLPTEHCWSWRLPGGCGVLLWQELDKLAAALCTRMAGWKSYLLGFLPVYSGVLAAGGEWNAGAAANGFLLTVLCFIAQAVTLWLQPLLRSYLAISMACGISSRKSLFEGCTLTGRLLRQAIGWAGKAFAALMSIQRVVTVQLDRSASRLGQLLTGSVPIVGQALSNAADAVLAGMQLLKSTLGIAALLSIGAEFAPLYLGLLIHLLFLSCCGWLAGIGGLEYCHKLLQCFAEAVRCMAAVTALFFMLFVVGIALLMLTGGG